ncbi:hypothetical protein JQ595_16605 [Bradyrhizobium japonicum]|uniref:P27 family phage terminase small subunit n=1 Tax=Bradyrhizobium japonicum TaxID=375 RepID=UPI001BAA42B6|nr:P27 family phage terminase small subunit [Bradyrhizobium japonicum]MBR0730374.1 hypothetical protein [Bradyrhizobium japonicum]
MPPKQPPTLTIVDPAMSSNPLAPPASLGEAGTELWRRIHRDYHVEDASGLETLTQICAAADTLAKLDAEIERDGMIIRSKSGMRENPLLKIQLATRSFVTRSLARMGFDVIQPRTEIGRPSGGGDYRGENRS